MESVDCMMGLEMDDDKLNGKPDSSRHNAKNIHVGFPNFPLFVFCPWGFFLIRSHSASCWAGVGF
jgi:hypothetical protein